jgi:hypothetical protein
MLQALRRAYRGPGGGGCSAASLEDAPRFIYLRLLNPYLASRVEVVVAIAAAASLDLALAAALARARALQAEETKLKKLKILPNPNTEANPGRAKSACTHNTATRMA